MLPSNQGWPAARLAPPGGRSPGAALAEGLLVLPGEREDLGDVPVGVVVGEDRAGQARRGRPACRAQVAGPGRPRWTLRDRRGHRSRSGRWLRARSTAARGSTAPRTPGTTGCSWWACPTGPGWSASPAAARAAGAA